MANDNQPNDVAPLPDVPAQPLATVDAIRLGQRGASRRRFARAGATGALLTLASQPGMACTVHVSMSGYQSALTAQKTGAAVSHAPSLPPSTGLPPSTWAGMRSWPCTSSSQYKTVFSCSRANATIAEKTLMQHCAGTGTASASATIARLLCAAHLNVLSGRSPFLTLQALQGIWNEFQLTGTYTPTAGVTPWSAADIVTYLNLTMDKG